MGVKNYVGTLTVNDKEVATVDIVSDILKWSTGLRYTLNDDGLSYAVVGIGTCTDTDIIIPAIYNNLPVTSINVNAFNGRSSLTSVTIPYSVTTIQAAAFKGCTSLTSIIIPINTTHIYANVFSGCDNLTIYCEAKSKPINWYSSWNSDNCPVVWDCAVDFAGVNEALENKVDSLTDLGITATAEELNYVDGVTSNIQAQLNSKVSDSVLNNYLPLSGGNLTGNLGIGNKYELSPAYNYENGYLIDICEANRNTMVAIHITGNSYEPSPPINSLFQFYDYSGGIINRSGLNLGYELGDMTIYRYNNRLYAHINQGRSFQTLSFTIMTNKSGLNPVVTNAAMHESDYTDRVVITPTKITSVESANKLTNKRTISLGGGLISYHATPFDGTANIELYADKLQEAYLSWGGKHIAGGLSPIDVACSSNHSANRFAFANPTGIIIEYSNDAGETWLPYNTTDQQKIKLVSGIGYDYCIGGHSTGATVNDKLRITLTGDMGLYTWLKKLLINISIRGTEGSNVIVEKASVNEPTNFIHLGTYDISGDSGWNSIPINVVIGLSQYSNSIRLTFGVTSVNSNGNALVIHDIMGIGDTYWSTPSNMARTGHLYAYDGSQNAEFPAEVKATGFYVNGNKAFIEGSSSIKIGNTTFTEEQLIKILNFIDSIELGGNE